MNSNDIRQILTGIFTDPAERTYWEQQLAKKIRQEAVTVDSAVRLPNMEVA